MKAKARVRRLWSDAKYFRGRSTWSDYVNGARECESGLLWDALYKEHGSSYDYEPTMAEQNAIAYIVSKTRPSLRDRFFFLMWQTTLGGFLLLLWQHLFPPKYEGID